MKKYKCLITSVLGDAGDIISLQENNQTRTRLKQGCICEFKTVEPAETKKRARKSKG